MSRVEVERPAAPPLRVRVHDGAHQRVLTVTSNEVGFHLMTHDESQSASLEPDELEMFVDALIEMRDECRQRPVSKR